MSVDVALPLVFVLSGAAGLIFELAWFHRAGLAFSNSIIAATVVLSSFMGGLAIGNGLAVWLAARVRRLMSAYALCLANRTEMSKKIVDGLQPRDEDERHFVEWMRMNCS